MGRYLAGIEQQGVTLPEGPVIMSPDRLFHSLTREVIYHRPQDFKVTHSPRIYAPLLWHVRACAVS